MMGFAVEKDERLRCCVVDEQGERCTRPSLFWVGNIHGPDARDNYTYCCMEHLDETRQDGDTIVPVAEEEGCVLT